MQCAEHQVSGQGGLDGNGCRLRIAHLADHDDFRVLAQQAAQAAREIELGARPGLRLAHSLEHLFHRVLDGDDMPALAEAHQVAQAGVDGGGLAAAAWTGEENGAGAFLKHGQEGAQQFLR